MDHFTAAESLGEQRGSLFHGVLGAIRLRRRSPGTLKYDSQFAPRRRGGVILEQIFQGTASNLLVHLGQFTRNHSRAVRPGVGDEVFQQADQSGRGFEEYRAPLLSRGSSQQSNAFPSFAGNEAQKKIPIGA